MSILQYTSAENKSTWVENEVLNENCSYSYEDEYGNVQFLSFSIDDEEKAFWRNTSKVSRLKSLLLSRGPKEAQERAKMSFFDGARTGFCRQWVWPKEDREIRLSVLNELLKEIENA